MLSLHAVTAWRFPPTYGYPVDYSDVDFAAQARKTLEEVVAETLGQTPPVPATARVIEGHPAAVLIDASRSADLLVVGSRGRGAFSGMLLGSVSQQCALHADLARYSSYASSTDSQSTYCCHTRTRRTAQGT